MKNRTKLQDHTASPSAQNKKKLSPLKYRFSIFQTCILVCFLKGLTFRKTAIIIGISFTEFYPMYLQILKMTGTHNKKELIAITKKMEMFRYLFNENGRIKRGILNEQNKPAHSGSLPARG